MDKNVQVNQEALARRQEEWATAFRWLDLCATVAVALLLAVVARPALSVAGTWLAETLGGHGAPVQIGAVCLISAAVWLMIIRLGGFRPADLVMRDWWRYPPTWLGGVLVAMVFVVGPQGWGYTLAEADWCAVLCALAAIGPVGAGLAVFAESLTKGSCRASARHGRDWVEDEAPITNPSQDRFGYDSIAQRVVRLLREHEAHTVGVVGPYGSGKTCLLNLIVYHLRPDERRDEARTWWRRRLAVMQRQVLDGHWYVCRVDAWGRGPERFAEQVLRMAVRTLGERVDVTSLATLPAHYAAAMSGSGLAWGSVLGSLLSVGGDPVDCLGRLDAILAAVRGRMLILVEDLDRNSSEELQNDILPALLDRVAKLRRVSFVLTIGAEWYDALNLMRICEHRESVSGAESAAVRSEVLKFREEQLHRYPEDVDTLTEEDRSKRLGDSFKDHPMAYLIESQGVDTIDHVANLMSNPRLLKHVLMRVRHAWEVLHGEIDFDDLLVFHVLQYGAPKAFGFTLNHLKEIRQVGHGEEASRREKRIEALEKAWAASLGEGAEKSGRELACFLFPEWRNHYGAVPQGVCVVTPTDYLARAQTERIGKEELRDQDVPRAVRTWRTDHAAAAYCGVTLAQALFSIPGLGDKLEQLGRELCNEDVHRIASGLFEIILQRHGRTAHRDLSGAFTSLWRMSIRREPWDGHEEWVVTEFSKALPISLRFANDIHHFWQCTDEDEARSARPHYELRQKTVTAARQLWESSPGALVNSLDATWSYSVRDFAVILSERAYGGEGFLPTDWTWLGDVLVRAANLAPDVILPQVAHLLVGPAASNTDEMSFKDKRGIQIFGDQFRAMAQMLAGSCDTSGLSRDAARQVAFVQQKAREWVAEQCSIGTVTGSTDSINEPRPDGKERQA